MFTSAILNTIIRYTIIAGSIGSILYYLKTTIVNLHEAELENDRLETRLSLKDAHIVELKESLIAYTENYNKKIERDKKIKQKLDTEEYTYINVFKKISDMETPSNEK